MPEIKEMNLTAFFEDLDKLQKEERISLLTSELPRFIHRVEPNIVEAPYLAFLTALAMEQGHTCTPLPTNAHDWESFCSEQDDNVIEVLSDIRPIVQEYISKINESANEVYQQCKTFLVNKDMLYTGRQLEAETYLASTFRKGFSTNHENLQAILDNKEALQSILDGNYGSKEHSFSLDRSQKEAVLRSLISPITVVTGGPGTGKTTTAKRIMEAFVCTFGMERVPRMTLAAPTGKAASRLSESLSAFDDHPSILSDQQKQALPTKSQTIHRLLGLGLHSSPKHHAENPLPYDFILVDEASMIDQQLMRYLLDAIAPSARLVLLGDRNQLPSVEAGAVFTQLYPETLEDETLYELMSDKTAAKDFPSKWTIQENTPSKWAIAQLKVGHRSGSDSGILKLADQIQNGQSALNLSQSYNDVHFHDFSEHKLKNLLKEFAEQQKEAFQQIQEASEAFKWIRKTQFLCLLNKGRWGAEDINKRVAEHLGDYKNQPVVGSRIIIKQNDYQNMLFNGEVGVFLHDNYSRGRYYFESADKGQTRAFLPNQLNQYTHAYALSVHKSQGSEYEHVHFLAPSDKEHKRHALFTRELLYTALTRSKKQFSYWGDLDHLKEAAKKPIRRFSKLSDRIWGQ